MGCIPYSGPWMNPIILGLGNWKQGCSNNDPTTFLSSLSLSDFNYKIWLAGQMFLGIGINESTILKGHGSV